MSCDLGCRAVLPLICGLIPGQQSTCVLGQDSEPRVTPCMVTSTCVWKWMNTGFCCKVLWVVSKIGKAPWKCSTICLLNSCWHFLDFRQNMQYNLMKRSIVFLTIQCKADILDCLNPCHYANYRNINKNVKSLKSGKQQSWSKKTVNYTGELML